MTQNLGCYRNCKTIILRILQYFIGTGCATILDMEVTGYGTV